MWLINTDNYTLHEVYDPGEDHPYAILSHTWEESEDDPLQREVTFHDMHNLNEARKKTGWSKIERTCALAKGYSLKWAWIDTCCIDKSSSAELTEAINSMFSWYQKANMCFVYLNDLPGSLTAVPDTRGIRDQLHEFFPRCRWFTRGWTLQELIAPKEIVFYDMFWTRVGTKTELKSIISNTTGVNETVLEDSENLSTTPVGRRMSWISQRNTKRVEDIAYCLFGIFDVNLPLIYGEGTKAFIRLQTAIAQQTNDMSLFAWCTDSTKYRQELGAQTYYGMFAPSPRYFRCCRNLVSLQDPLTFESQSFTVTNRGLEFQVPVRGDKKEADYMMSLLCHDGPVGELKVADENLGVLVIQLIRTLKGFARHHADIPYAEAVERNTVWTHIWPSMPKSIHVPMVVRPSESRLLETRLQNAFRFRCQCPSNIHIRFHGGLGLSSAMPSDRSELPESTHAWDWINNTFLTGGYPMFTGMVWPGIFGGSEGTRWSHALRIVFGFTPSLPREMQYNAEDSVSLQPWVALIAGDVSSIDVGGGITVDRFKDLVSHINTKMPYGSVISTIGRLIRDDVHKGYEFPTSAMLTPSKELKSSQRENREKERIILSLALKDVEENGIVIHEVTIRLEPVPLPIEYPLRQLRI